MSTDALRAQENDETASEPAPKSLRSRVMSSGAWTTLGYGFSQVIRLGSNLLLTRLLAPEAFGLMNLINAILQGLQMFSDIGVGTALVQHKQGEEKPFINTAWSLQTIRGVFLGLICAAIAYPISLGYSEPVLFPMLLVAAFSAVLAGVASPSIFLANRQLKLARLTILEIVSHFVSVVAMLAIAYVWPSVWALLIGTLIGVVVKTVGSHLFLGDHRCRFAWDRNAVKELINFGRWIFLSTALAFAAGSLDRFLSPKLVSMEFLGYYGIALMLVRALTQVVGQISGRVMFAALSEAYRDSKERFDKVLRKSRLLVIGVLWLAAIVLAFVAVPMINFLYPEKYAQVGTILSLLAIGEVIGAVGFSYGGALLAIGQSQRIVQILVPEIIIKLAAMGIGTYLGGPMGFVIGMSLSRLPIYFVEAYVLAKAGVWQKNIDIPAMLIALPATAGLLYYAYWTMA